MDAPRRVAVAASAGRDSTALLHCVARAARAAGIEVVALHVHHGLMDDADDWLAQVRRQARQWGAAFDSRRLAGRPAAGESVEAWARAGRYAALAEMAREAHCRLVLLAHHRRDQAETWLLQALRGAGPAGLSAMPGQVERGGIVWARPWLQMPREAIEAYARRHRLRYAVDPSNEEGDLARALLRRSVWPALLTSFPQAEAALAASAGKAQLAARLAEEVAALDLPPLLDGARLVVARWRVLPSARRRNALRAWLRQCALLPAPSAALLDRLESEVPSAMSGRWPLGTGELRLYRGHLSWCTPAGAVPPAAPCIVDLRRPGRHAVPGWAGEVEVVAVERGGIGVESLARARVCAREGGERFRVDRGAVSRSLKQQFQSRGVPAWERDGPVIHDADGRLVFVAGLGLDGGALAPPGEPQRLLRWLWAPAVMSGRRQPGG